jgi:hypothetical protein
VKVLCLVTAWPRYVERARYLGASLRSLREHVDHEGFEVDWCVTTETEGCDAEAVKIQGRVCRQQGFRLVHRRGRPSLGAHLTDTLQASGEWDLLFYTQEDWEARHQVPLAGAAWLLNSLPDVMVVRLKYSRHVHDLRALVEGTTTWAEMLPSSEWFFAHNPYVARREFIEAMLPIPHREGGANRRAKALVAERGWRFAALAPPHPFRHIGSAVPAMTEKHAARAARRRRAQ